MLFMVIEQFHPGKVRDVYRRFREKGRLAPDDVRYVTSWVDLEFRRCFQVMEAPDESALAKWTRNWNDLVDFEIIPVRTSADAAAAIQGSDSPTRSCVDSGSGRPWRRTRA